MTVKICFNFLDGASCSLITGYRRFGIFRLSEALVNSYKTALQNRPEVYSLKFF